MDRVWLAAWIGLMAACSPEETGLIPREGAVSRPAELQEPPPGRELIPAEWTVAEDTSETGEVTTVSLQLPNARDIGGLLEEEAPRLILRCVGGKVQAFIDTERTPEQGGALLPDSHSVQVQLDSAPACE